MNLEKIIDSGSNKVHEMKKSFNGPIMTGSVEPYNYEDKGAEQSVLVEQRRKYIVTAIEELLGDTAFVESLLKHAGKPGEENVVRWIREKLYPILSEHHGLKEESSSGILENLGKEYNQFAIDREIINYVSRGDVKNLMWELANRAN